MNTATNRQIIEEASNWFVDFRVGDIDASSRQQFHDWLRRSPDHIQAYLDIAMTYAELPAPDPNGNIEVSALIDAARASGDANVVSLVPGAHGSGVSRQSPSARTTSRRVLAIAASFLLSTVLLSAFYFVYFQLGTYSTDIGEQRSLILADGSTVELNSRSRIRVRYADDERRVELLQGQALFQVAKNKERPFIVRTGDAEVRAVGTQFDVYRTSTGTVITVVEGKVSVDFAGSAETPAPETTEKILREARPPSPVFLAAGEQLTVGGQPVPKPHPVNPSTVTAWTQRQLIFESASLSEVAEEFNRYSARPIIVEVQALENFHVSGTYSSSNPESLLRFLRVQPGIKLIETDREIRIARQ